MDYGRSGGVGLPGMTPAVRLLLYINGGVFILNFIFAGAVGSFLAVSKQGLLEGFGLGVVRLVTYQFAHSYGDPLHLLFNMLILFFFGTFVEAEIGKRGLLRLYLISGVVGGVLQVLLTMALGEGDALILGASGACYGIMVYAAFMAPRMRVIFIIFPVQLGWLVAFLVGLGLYSLVLEFRHEASSTAHGAHLGGALWGFLAFRYFRNWYMTADYRQTGVVDWFRKRQDQRRQQGRARREAILDELLEKVQREGMSALSAAERRFLEKTSKDLRDR